MFTYLALFLVSLWTSVSFGAAAAAAAEQDTLPPPIDQTYRLNTLNNMPRIPCKIQDALPAEGRPLTQTVRKQAAEKYKSDFTETVENFVRNTARKRDESQGILMGYVVCHQLKSLFAAQEEVIRTIFRNQETPFPSDAFSLVFEEIPFPLHYVPEDQREETAMSILGDWIRDEAVTDELYEAIPWKIKDNLKFISECLTQSGLPCELSPTCQKAMALLCCYWTHTTTMLDIAPTFKTAL